MRIVASPVRALMVGLSAAGVGLAALVVGGLSIAAIGATQAPAGQTGQQPPPPPPGTGLVMGQVVDASGKSPIAGAIVTITGGSPIAMVGVSPVTMVSASGGVVSGGGSAAPMPEAPRQILTDAEGHFMFRALSAGRYQIRATATGYISGGYGQLRPDGSAQSLELTRDDEKRGDLTVRLWKSATVSGTIIDETGEPVVACPVRAIRRTVVNGRPRFSTGMAGTTDDRGVYRIASLPPGDYLVAVMSTQTTLPTAMTETYIQQATAGANASDFLRDLSNSGAPFPLLGGYRIGDFILQASNSGRGPVPVEEGRILAYPTQFFPSASVAAQATVLTLSSGENRGAIDLQLKLQPTVRVSGTITGPEGPGRNLGVKLFPLGADEFTSESGIETANTVTDATGAFTFLGVTPGQYILKCLRVPRPVTTGSGVTTSIEVQGPNGMMSSIMSMSSGSSAALPLPTDPTLWATMPVNVGETDVAGLSVPLRPGARISGRLVFEGSKEQPGGDELQRASILINPISGTPAIQIMTAAKRVEANGQFASVGYPPGRYTVSAALPVVQIGGAAWRFKSATFRGRDVSDEGLVVEGADISDLVITFTDRPTAVTGTVVDAKGQPDPNASVIVVPADSQVWRQGTINARRIRSARTTSTGAFSLGDLPPGAYFIAAISDETLENWQDPKTLEAITRVATHFTLGDGEKTTQSLITRTLR